METFRLHTGVGHLHCDRVQQGCCVPGLWHCCCQGTEPTACRGGGEDGAPGRAGQALSSRTQRVLQPSTIWGLCHWGQVAVALPVEEGCCRRQMAPRGCLCALGWAQALVRVIKALGRAGGDKWTLRGCAGQVRSCLLLSRELFVWPGHLLLCFSLSVAAQGHVD